MTNRRARKVPHDPMTAHPLGAPAVSSDSLVRRPGTGMHVTPCTKAKFGERCLGAGGYTDASLVAALHEPHVDVVVVEVGQAQFQHEFWCLGWPLATEGVYE